LLDVLDELRAAGITFELDRAAPTFRLQWSARPTAAGSAWLSPWEPWLLQVAIGRHTGHAPAVCSVCGELAIVAIVTTGGTRRGRRSAPFQRCRMTNGWTGTRERHGQHTVTLKGCEGRMEIREIDFAGVARVKPPGIPQVKTWLRKQGRLT
jgi:hypothetical protein